MKLWLDAQLPPLLARWINEQVLSTNLPRAIKLLRGGEPWVEIRLSQPAAA